jgi:hypothetical protein
MGLLRRRWRELLLAVVASFFALEIGLRVVHLASYSGTLEDLYRDPSLPAAGSEVTLGAMLRPSPNPSIVYELKPGLDVRFQGSRVTTNAHGWREGEIAPRKNGRRILGLGDSVMFGWGVEEQERYMDVLERRLDEERPQQGWETVVTAVPGYNLVMEVELLEQRGLALDPDLIVYGYFDNDHHLPNFVQDPPRVLSTDSFLARYAGILAGRSRAVFTSRLDGRQLFRIRDASQVPEPYRHLVGPEPFRKALERLAELSRETDTPVVIFDFTLPGLPRELRPEELVYVGASDAGSVEELRSNQQHPTPQGHRALADALYRALTERGLLDPVAGGWGSATSRHQRAKGPGAGASSSSSSAPKKTGADAWLRAPGPLWTWSWPAASRSPRSGG